MHYSCNGPVTGRDLECNGVPDDICTRLADHVVTRWDPASIARSGPLVKVGVNAELPCVVPDGARCFDVKATTGTLPNGSSEGIHSFYCQTVDGTLLGPEGAVLGTFPVSR